MEKKITDKMDGVEVQPHIQLRKGQVQPVVLTMGDPKRVDQVGQMVEGYKDLEFNREFKSLEAIQGGEKFTVISHARERDVCDLLVRPGFPAVTTPRVYQLLQQAAAQQQVTIKTGVVLTNGLFYGDQSHKENLQYWSQFTDIVDCEFQCLFLVGSVRNIETGGIATVDGSPLEWNQDNYDPTGRVVAEGKKKMLEIAIAACVDLAREYRLKEEGK
ncbi:purine nucleoside phosphorylase, putative [Eimeria brunetti]|uniref:Purine nucleoside phosphorylase, putative n=1 Tax=Eimeria brunetti TaxID=51314 RepID=U6LEM2_9EIME|nr:purine nucleoside phosphorylase, putative [Eimeria brunetti]